MTCRFDLSHYCELLDAAKDGGYAFTFFDHEPRPGDIFLRHDVDLSLEAALMLAELEAEEKAQSTYFLMTQSVFYNLASAPGEAAVERLRALGHAVGLHAVWPRAELDGRFDSVVAWHNPDPPYMSEAINGAQNVMAPPFFSREHYRSDSNQSWRSGCPHEALARGDFEWLQLLTHPEIWAYEGSSMRETMESMLAAERELRWRQLGEDRIDLS
jgi:hypothetical protein